MISISFLQYYNFLFIVTPLSNLVIFISTQKPTYHPHTYSNKLMIAPSQLCDNYAWCNYEAVEETSFKAQILIFILLVFVTSVIIIYYRKLHILRKDKEYRYLFGGIFVKVFIISFAWLFSSYVKVIINILAYKQYIETDPVTFPQPTSSSPIVIYSAIFNLFDLCATFFVVSLIIFIPYQWFMSILKQIDDRREIPLEMRKLLKQTYHILKITKIYGIGRVLLIVFYLVETVLIVHTKIGCSITKIAVAYVIAESIVIVLFYVYGYYFARKVLINKLIVIPGDVLRKLKFEYFMLLFVLICRVILNFFFNGLASQILNYQPLKNCYDADSSNGIKRFIFLIVGETVLHFLPIFIVIYIYRPNIEQRRKNQSIIQYEPKNEDKDEDDNNINKSGNTLKSDQYLAQKLNQ